MDNIGLSLGFLVVMAILCWARGLHWRIPCMIAMAILMGLVCSLHTGRIWVFFACGLPFGGCLSLSNKNRGVWCAFCAAAASLALVLGGYLAWWVFLLYCLANYLLGYIINNKLKLNQVFVDSLIGIGFACLVFLI